MNSSFNQFADFNFLPGFGAQYVNTVSEYTNLLTCLQETKSETENLIKSIHTDKANYAYAEGKWSVKGVILHCIESERVFQYRALRFSRLDQTPLPGFDEDWYGEQNNAENRTLSDLLEEFTTVRLSTIQLFKGMTTEMLDFVGTMNKAECTARNLGWMIAGHTRHHCNVLKERYMNSQ